MKPEHKLAIQKDKLIHLYQDLYNLTNPLCKQCRAPQSCCSPEYCDMAEYIMKEEGIELEKTNHPTLPYMGANGCIVPPHLRPLCTRHHCSINSLGFFPNDKEKTERYFKIIEEIDEIEFTIDEE